MKVTSVTALAGYNLQVAFDDNVAGIVNISDVIETGVFSILKDETKFYGVYTNGYCIAWSDELEIDALAIYAEILNKDPEEIFNVDLRYAAN